MRKWILKSAVNRYTHIDILLTGTPTAPRWTLLLSPVLKSWWYLSWLPLIWLLPNRIQRFWAWLTSLFILLLLCHQHIRCSVICIINEPYIFIIKKKFAERNVDHKTPKVIFSQTLQEDPVLELLFRFWIFYYPSFLSQTLTIHRTARERRRRFLSHSATFIRSRTFRHLFTTLHVRWLSRIFNRIACVSLTATRWNLPPSRNTTWLIDDAMLIFVC